VKLIVADTGPLNYLIQIRAMDVLHGLVELVILPAEVLCEMNADGAPPEVRAWAQNLPEWVRVESPAELIPPDSSLSPADRAAISLAVEKRSLLLMDDRRARDIAAAHSLVTIGTLGILEAAAAMNLISLPETLKRLGQTSMFLSASLIRQALERDALRLSRTSHEGFPNASPDTPPLPTDKNA
jgi:predicted nucleic acid-binding protein